VAVEHGLAVLDAFGEAAGGDGRPAVGFGQLAGGVDDELVTQGAFAIAAPLDRAMLWI
jgi:hypothetical protein